MVGLREQRSTWRIPKSSRSESDSATDVEKTFRQLDTSPLISVKTLEIAIRKVPATF